MSDPEQPSQAPHVGEARSRDGAAYEAKVTQDQAPPFSHERGWRITSRGPR
jgi:hypothetical protein